MSRWVKWSINPFHFSIMLIIQSSLKFVSDFFPSWPIFVLVLDIFILSSFYFVICYYTRSYFFSIFLSSHLYFFFLALFKFNGVVYDLWVWGGSHDVWRVELFITSWPEFISEKSTQSKSSPDQIIIQPNRSSKWMEVRWDIHTVDCLDGQFFIRIWPKSTVVHT
jgi:hypothetical protein